MIKLRCNSVLMKVDDSKQHTMRRSSLMTTILTGPSKSPPRTLDPSVGREIALAQRQPEGLDSLPPPVSVGALYPVSDPAERAQGRCGHALQAFIRFLICLSSNASCALLTADLAAAFSALACPAAGFSALPLAPLAPVPSKKLCLCSPENLTKCS